MNKKPVALLTVLAENRMIGKSDGSPLPYDFDTGYGWMFHIEGGVISATGDEGPLKHSLIFGRNVYEEFLPYEGALPAGLGINVVISSSLANPDGTPRALPTTKDDESTINPRLVAVGSIEQALELATAAEKINPRPGDMCLVVGGQRIYKEIFPHATILRKFHMRTSFEGDVFFPEHDPDEWTAIYKSKPKVEKNKVDGKDVELQVIEYVRNTHVNDTDLAPVIESIKQANLAFDQLEPQE